MLKKIIHFALSHTPLEHMDPEKAPFFMNGVWKDHVLRYEFFIKKIAKGRILDIACGEGYGSALLAESMPEVVGVDISPEAVEHAKQKYSSWYENLSFIAQDALVFLESNKKPFDVIFSFETIEHIREYEKFLFLLKKNLKQRGTLILSTPNKLFSDYVAGDTFNIYHVKEFYTEELVLLVERIFGVKPQLFFCNDQFVKTI